MSKQGRVHPMIRENHELESQGTFRSNHNPTQMNHRVSTTTRPRASSTENWNVIQKEVKTLSRWKHYKKSMRFARSTDSQRSDGPGPKEDCINRQRVGRGFSRQTSTLDSDVEGLGADERAMLDTQGYVKPLPLVDSGKPIAASISSSRALIVYFAKLAKMSTETEQEIDFHFVEELLIAGADINFTDRHGQSIMHEVARIWHVDVAQFLVENGGDVNKADHFGRTPLHVAAAVDYPEMVEFLVNNKANIHALTYQESQTPTHYASKNDAVKALKVLLKLGGNPEDRDYKQRTPLLVAAELDRSETAKFLIEQSAAAGVQDDGGNCAMSLMISKMPPVAKEALDQFHTTDRANRKQYYYLNYLEPSRPSNCHDCDAKTPLQAVVQFKQLELIMHPVFQRLIEIKWSQFGRRGTILQIFVQMLYVLLCTALGVTIHIGSDSKSNYYQPPSKYWWRIVMEGFAVSLTVYFFLQEFLEIRSSKRSHKRWQAWRVRELEKDLKFCHPRWPEERKYLEMELREIADSGISYFNDAWNYFDWITYGWVSAVIVTRILGVAVDNFPTARSLHPKVFAIALIFIWLRLMKFFRAFGALGPFIVIVGHIIDDILKFGFLYFEFFIPYVCAFWMIFGGEENAKKMQLAGQDSKGWRNFNDLMYSVWQLTNVGNYPWDALLAVDRLMAQILCGTYLAVFAIVCLNLFIALMSDTFQRVYDNAKANAAMQRAITVLSFEESMSRRKQEKMRRYFNQKLAPEELYYDDDSTQTEGTLERMTHQIKDVVDDMYELMVHPADETKPRSGNKQDIEMLRTELQKVSERHEKSMLEMRKEMAEMKSLLLQLTQKHSHAIQYQSPLQSEASLFPASRLPSPLDRHGSERSSKKSGGTRSHKKKNRKHHLPDEDEDDDKLYPVPGPYPSLPVPPSLSTVGSSLPNVSYVTPQRKNAHT